MKCRLPRLVRGPTSWTSKMIAAGPRDLLQNVVMLKFENSVVDLQLVRYARAQSPLRNLSIRRSSLGFLPYHAFLPPPPPTRNIGAVLKVLDISRTGVHAVRIADKWVFSDLHCQVTHLYMEQCPIFVPRIMPEHLKIEYLSIAGYVQHSVYGSGPPSVFLVIKGFATIPTMREINASGSCCSLNQVQRDTLIAIRPNILFDLSADFRESPPFF